MDNQGFAASVAAFGDIHLAVNVLDHGITEDNNFCARYFLIGIGRYTIGVGVFIDAASQNTGAEQ